MAPEIHRRFLDVAVHALQPRLHRDHDVGDREHHVRDDDRHQTRVDVDREEERQQGGAEHHLGTGERQDDEHVDGAPPAKPVPDEGDRHEGP
ncbi:MAG: hypothetical protein ACR2K9_03040 [Solirubrobacteraceae bacterium]